MEEFEEKTITCKDCGKTFVFTKGEQEFFKLKGLSHLPKRCRECREKRKEEKEHVLKSQH